MIIFAVVWYWFYYGILVKIVNEKIDERKFPGSHYKFDFKYKEKYLSISKKNSFPGVKLKIYDHSKSPKELNRLSRYWHVLFFSASVLLGIRFKREWIEIGSPLALGQQSFIYLVTAEWLLGIGLYVTFALLVKGARFEFIKGLLGF